LRRSLKEKINVPIGGLRERSNNQFDVGFSDSFNNAQILIFLCRKVENWIGSQAFLMSNVKGCGSFKVTKYYGKQAF